MFFSFHCVCLMIEKLLSIIAQNNLFFSAQYTLVNKKEFNLTVRCTKINSN